MSTNQSEHYQLHLWEPEDNFLRSEFNENFTKLDGAAKVTFGSYTGDGESSRLIPLGFTPAAVYLCRNDGTDTTEYGFCGGLAMPGLPAFYTASCPQLAVEKGGFRVKNASAGSRQIMGNVLNTVYYYMAFA